jgi:hypothetical protein
MKTNRSTLKLAIVALVLVIGSTMAPVVMAAPPVPSSGVATVDGNYGEWNLANDFFANMVEAGKDDGTLLSKLYLRYDCATETVYALVLAEPGQTIKVENSDGVNNFIKVSSAPGNGKIVSSADYPPDGSVPGWGWIGLSADGLSAAGWEASAPLTAVDHADFYPHTYITPGRTSRPVGWYISVNPSCQVAALGDYVWSDANANGIQDDGATGISGVTVNLLDGTCTTQMSTTTTASDGYYHFTDLVPGAYCVQFILPGGYDFTTQDVGSDDELDSDADPGTGKTVSINLTAGETDNSWDAGLISGGVTAITLSSLSANGGGAQSPAGLAVIALSFVLAGSAVTFQRRRSR